MVGEACAINVCTTHLPAKYALTEAIVIVLLSKLGYINADDLDNHCRKSARVM